MYQPEMDYANAYDAIIARQKANFAQKNAQLEQTLATNGVRGSGVGMIPREGLAKEELLAEGDTAGKFALAQAQTGIEDRRAAENFERQKQLSQFQFDQGNALQRKQGQNQLWGQLGAGVLGAAGSMLGPGGVVASQIAANAVQRRLQQPPQ